MSRPTHRNGFTLIELSIVLVIIGLIVGGIVVGKELVTSAQVRKSINMTQQYETMVLTFKLKYGGLPGDLKNASTFGFRCWNTSYCNDPGQTPNGNGDGMIYTVDGGGHLNAGQEHWHFWSHLESAGFVKRRCFDNTSGGGTCGDFRYGMAFSSDAIPLPPVIKPETTTGAGGIGIIWTGVYNANTSNSLYVIPATHAFYFGTWPGLVYGVIQAANAYAIDVKVDNGNPLSGKIRAEGMTGESASDGFRPGWNSAGTTACLIKTSTTPETYVYNVAQTGTSYSQRCPLIWQTSF